jgi:hypothetical protein
MGCREKHVQRAHGKLMLLIFIQLEVDLVFAI